MALTILVLLAARGVVNLLLLSVDYDKKIILRKLLFLILQFFYIFNVFLGWSQSKITDNIIFTKSTCESVGTFWSFPANKYLSIIKTPEKGVKNVRN